MKKIKLPAAVFLFTITALLSVAAFTGYERKDAVDVNGWLRAKKQSAIICGPYQSTATDPSLYSVMEKTNDHGPSNNIPSNKDGGNGCSHQQAGSLCDITGSRRRFGKVENC